MKRTKLFFIVMAAAFCLSAVHAAEDQPQKGQADAEPKIKATNPVVEIVTSKGTIVVELDPKKAPLSVANFLQYTESKFYDDTIFHRVIKDFMIQGGGMTADMKKKKTKPPIKNEAANGLKNKRGTIAMARTNIPDSATSQFFINHKDNAFLDFRDPSPRGIGYAVFGKVIKGMKVVDAIATTQTRKPGDVPLQTVTIKSVRLVKPEAPGCKHDHEDHDADAEKDGHDKDTCDHDHDHGKTEKKEDDSKKSCDHDHGDHKH